jgi:hypothetical protein
MSKPTFATAGLIITLLAACAPSSQYVPTTPVTTAPVNQDADQVLTESSLTPSPASIPAGQANPEPVVAAPAPVQKTQKTQAVPPPLPPAPKPPPPPAPALESGQCHSSYEGECVPITSDVDCLGGSGNGPAYVGQVRVVGPDEYDLDRDGDGVGCERD